jgi:hypothetical protein
MFEIKYVEKINTHILFPIIFFFQKSCRSLYNVEICGGAREATDDNTVHALCMLDN